MVEAADAPLAAVDEVTAEVLAREATAGEVIVVDSAVDSAGAMAATGIISVAVTVIAGMAIVRGASDSAITTHRGHTAAITIPIAIPLGVLATLPTITAMAAPELHLTWAWDVLEAEVW
jgi:hypothetical protein